MLFDLVTLIETVGYVGIAAMVFAESGLLFGVLFPGDSLLFTAGLLASQGYLDIRILIVLSTIAAILGDSVGYAIGRKWGSKVFSRDGSLFFDKEHIGRAERFYARHGGKTIILARFLHFIRTLAPIMAGVGNMEYRTFLSYNVVGGLLWAVGVPLLGFYFGSVIPDIDRYLLPAIFLIALISLSPTIAHIVRHKLKKGS